MTRIITNNVNGIIKVNVNSRKLVQISVIRVPKISPH